MGASRDFDATDDVITVTDYAAMQNIFSGGGTICCWCNPATVGEGSNGRIAQKGTGTTPNPGWIFYTASGNKWGFGYRFNVSTGVWVSTNSISFDTWTYYTVTYDNSSTTNDPSMYLNGVSETVIESIAPGNTPTSDAGVNLFIGNDSSGARTFDGMLAYLQMFDRVLTVPEIQETMRKPGSIRNGLVGFWPLTDSGTTMRNLNNVGGTGAVTGAAEVSIGPPISKFL